MIGWTIYKPGSVPPVLRTGKYKVHQVIKSNVFRLYELYTFNFLLADAKHRRSDHLSRPTIARRFERFL